MSLGGPDRSEKLIHVGSGMEFSLSTGSETTIGRKDPVTGIFPDIDLTPVDHQRSISRRHAKIYRRGPKFFVGAEIGFIPASSPACSANRSFSRACSASSSA